jgi:hypothetical protein
MGLAVSSFFFVQASAQIPPPVQMTGCITKGGDSKNWAFGDTPLKPCSTNDDQVTFVLQTGLDAQAAAGATADSTLQANIDAEAAARAAADATLQTALNNEALARQGADAALQVSVDANTAKSSANMTDIAANTSSIASNSSIIDSQGARIDAAEAEIGTNLPTSRITQNATRSIENRIEMVGPSVSLDPSRIDLNENQNVATAAWRPGYITTGEGAIGHNRTFHRMVNYNPVSGEAMVHGEINHSLDPWSTLTDNSGFWYCNVGTYLSHGDFQYNLNQMPDDNNSLSSAGFNLSSSTYFAFQFKNTSGTPYVRVQVYDSEHQDAGAYGAQQNYVDVTADMASSSVTGWFFGNRGINSSSGDTPSGHLYVGLSHPQLRAMLINSGRNVQIPTSDNHVLVDLNSSVMNLKYTPNGTCRVAGC